ncbi:hypothetical protein QTN25_008055 [Entamoeba marina]
MAVNVNYFDDLNSVLDALLIELNNFDIDEETRDIEYMVDSHDIELNEEDDVTLIMKYTTYFNELDEYLKVKRQELNEIEITINGVMEFIDYNLVLPILNKKKQNLNVVINCMNHIVDRMNRIEVNIHNKRIDELSSIEHLLNRKSYVKEDPERNQVFLIEQLSKWISEKQLNTNKQFENCVNQLLDDRNMFNGYDIIYDSNTDENLLPKSEGDIEQQNNGDDHNDHNNYDTDNGDDHNNDNNYDLHESISNSIELLKKWSNQNLWKIIFDSDACGCSEYAFSTYNANDGDELYSFGDDIYIYPIGVNSSHCEQEYYDYNEERDALVDNGQENAFAVTRIIVIQMK